MADTPVIALDIPQEDARSAETQAYFDLCQEKLGLIPNVLIAYAFNEGKLRAFTGMYNELMLGASGVSKLEREMIAVTVASVNKCLYCITAHGAAVREMSGDPVMGEKIAINYRVANLPPKQRAMLDFVWKLTETPAKIDAPDRQALRNAGWSDRDIWDIANVAGFFNMTTRVAQATDMRPNTEYFAQAR